MFDNIGSKIKNVGQIILIAGIIASLFVGIIIMLNGNFGIIGFAVLIVGTIASAFSGYMLYGFGEIIDNLTIIAEAQSPGSTKKIKVAHTDAQPQTASGKCDFCGSSIAPLKPSKYENNGTTQYVQVCDNCFKNYNCKDLF